MFELIVGEQITNYTIDQAIIDAKVAYSLAQFTTPFTGSQIHFAEMDNQKVVVKMNDSLKHEWNGLTIAHQHGFNVPEPLILADNGRVMVTTMMEGDLLANLPDANDRRYELGQMVKGMHDIKQTTNWEQRGCNDYGFYDRAIDKWKDTGIEELAPDGRAQAILHTLAPVMENYLPQATTGFTHRDVHDEQAIVGQQVGLIDFENWGDNDLPREVGMYLFHKLRKQEPIVGYEAFAEGATGQEQRDVALYYSLFIAGNALQYFAENNPGYLTAALHNFNKTLEYVDETL